MSLRRAINNKCRECIYCPITGTGPLRQLCAAYTLKLCPLGPVRPKPRPTNALALNRYALRSCIRGIKSAILYNNNKI